jgi:hypothetical protein
VLVSKPNMDKGATYNRNKTAHVNLSLSSTDVLEVSAVGWKSGCCTTSVSYCVAWNWGIAVKD